MIMKHGMEHYVLKLYKVNKTDGPEVTMNYSMTLNYFMTLSNLAKLNFVLIVGSDIKRAFTGPMVLWFNNL